MSKRSSLYLLIQTFNEKYRRDLSIIRVHWMILIGFCRRVIKMTSFSTLNRFKTRLFTLVQVYLHQKYSCESDTLESTGQLLLSSAKSNSSPRHNVVEILYHALRSPFLGRQSDRPPAVKTWYHKLHSFFSGGQSDRYKQFKRYTTRFTVFFQADIHANITLQCYIKSTRLLLITHFTRFSGRHSDKHNSTLLYSRHCNTNFSRFDRRFRQRFSQT